MNSPFPTTFVASGRYAVFHSGAPCGEDAWQVEHAGDVLIVTGVQELAAPFPFPNRQEYRVTLSPAWRPLALEIAWHVGARTLVARHAADGARWRVRIQADGQVREQEGDFPDACEVEFTTPLFVQFMLARRDFQVGGEHEFPVLRIGPPYMAVSPERMLLRCVERGVFDSPRGPVAAKRYAVSLPPRGEDEGYTLWADEHDVVLATFEGAEPRTPWMTLVEHRRA